MIFNFGLLKNPLNWLTVVLMVMFAGIAFHFIMEYQLSPLNPAQEST